MPKRSHEQVVDRLRRLIDLLAEGPFTAGELRERLRPAVAKRTLEQDLAWLQERFPDQVARVRAESSRQGRVAWRWVGPAPYLLDRPMTWLSEAELAALVAARGLLRAPDPGRPASQDHPASGLLAEALDALLARTGTGIPAAVIARQVVSVSCFGAEPVDQEVLATCLRATTVGDALRVRYRNLAGTEAYYHLLPQRLALIHGEWYLIAWAGSHRPGRGRCRTFKLARVQRAEALRQPPPGAPASIPPHEVDALLSTAFYATATDRRQRVTVRVHPAAWPHVQNRRWGADQRIEDLPDGWRRLSFVTTGLDECVPWVLSFGGRMVVEGPDELFNSIAQSPELTRTASTSAELQPRGRGSVAGCTG